ncbi:MAG: metal-dependent hydrolase, partial [Pseudomonadota bacterium]
MDNLTHGLTGALMGQIGLKKKTGLGLVALVLGANLPDIDVVCLLWLDSTEALGFRRGITHGPVGVALLPLGLAGLLWAFDRWQERRGKRPQTRDPVSLRWLYLLGLIGAISHSLMDWLNVYGVRFLYPFDKGWYYGDTLFIIDVWLWALLILSVWWSARAEKRGRSWRGRAVIGAATALLFIAMNWAVTTLDYAASGTKREPYPVRFISAPVPFFFWQREDIAQLHNGEWISSDWDGEDFGYGYRRSAASQCVMPELT